LLSISRVLSLLSPNPTTPQTAPTLLRRRGGAVLTLLRRTPTHHPNKKEKWWWLRAWRGFGRGVASGVASLFRRFGLAAAGVWFV